MLTHAQMVARAIEIAAAAHAGLVDLAGAPYFSHAQRVAKRFNPTFDPHACCVAYLHDVVEDGPGWTLARLRAEGFCGPVVDAVDLLTKRPEDHGAAYPAAYVARLCANPLAYNVKIADLLDNLDLARIPLEKITAKDQRRMNHYTRMLGRLIGQMHADHMDQLLEAAKGSVNAYLVRPDGTVTEVDAAAVAGLGSVTKESLH